MKREFDILIIVSLYISVDEGERCSVNVGELLYNRDFICLKVIYSIMVKVYAVKLDEDFIKTKFSKLLIYISEEKQERIKRFHKFEDACRSLIGDVLIRYIICKNLNLKNEKLVFRKNEYGKPFLFGSSNIHFNVSHSGEWVVCAIHSLPVGIDIELIQPIDFSIAERFFLKDEYKDLMIKSDFIKLSYFYELWTLKESYIKAVGKGLSINLNSFSIKVSRSNIIITTENEFKGCFFKKYDIDQKYKMAVCANTSEFFDKAKIIQVPKLYKEIFEL